MLVCLLIVFESNVCRAGIILTDSFGNLLTQPLAGGPSTGFLSGPDFVQQAPLLYTLNVYANNGLYNGITPPAVFPGDRNSFYFENSISFGTAILVSSAWSSTFSSDDLQLNSTANQYLGTATTPITATGLYQFVFYIPHNGVFETLLLYTNTLPSPGLDRINITIVDFEKEKIVSDSLGNSVMLSPFAGNYTATIDATVDSTNYVITVDLNNGRGAFLTEIQEHTSLIPGIDERFFFSAPSSGLFGDAVLTQSSVVVTGGKSGPKTFLTTDLSYLGNFNNPTTVPVIGEPGFTTARYRFFFNIPTGGVLFVNLTYLVAGTEPGANSSTTTINFRVRNTASASATGDPQFVGLLGQSFQVHGIDGGVYSMISQPSMQLNSRFVFLAEGTCPIATGSTTKISCWSHPGSYLGELALMTSAGDHVIITAGSADSGFRRVLVNNVDLISTSDSSGNVINDQSLSIAILDSHHITIKCSLWTLNLDNSDHFLNLASVHVSAWSRLIQSVQPHGLLGQTWNWRTNHIEGHVEDYFQQAAGEDSSKNVDAQLFGIDNYFNRFQVIEA